MDMIKKYFPVSTRANDVTGLVISILIYIIAGVVLGIFASILGKIPVIGILVSIIMAVVDLYCLIGIILAVLIFLKVVK